MLINNSVMPMERPPDTLPCNFTIVFSPGSDVFTVTAPNASDLSNMARGRHSVLYWHQTYLSSGARNAIAISVDENALEFLLCTNVRAGIGT